MPTAIRLVPRPDPNAISDETRQAHQSVGDFDLLLERLLAGVQASFSYMWGHKGNPRPRATQENGQVGIIELLNEVGAEKLAKMFSTHSKLVALLIAEGVASFEPWELTPPYAVTIDEQGNITVGEDLNEAWVVAEAQTN